MRALSVWAISAIFALGGAIDLHAQEVVDSTVARRIIEEATARSQVMDHAFYLTDVFGPRLTGTPGYKAAGTWALNRLKLLGLQNVHTESVPWGRSWVERRIQVQLITPGTANLTAVGVPWSLSTHGSVEAAPVLAPLPACSADRQDYTEFYARHRGKLRGRIVLGARPLPRDREPGGRWYGGRTTDDRLRAEGKRAEQEAQDEPAESLEPYRMRRRLYGELNAFLRAEGALAILYPSPSYGGEIRLQGPVGCRTQEASGRDRRFPLPPASAVLTWEHYNRVVRLVEANQPVRIRVQLEANLPERSDAAFNILGDIPGTTKPDELVLIGAHLDSWPVGTGATDNAAGASVMIEAMRILRALDLRPRRTIRIALWAGEEGAGLGSRTYVRDHLSADYQLDGLADPTPLRPLPEHARLSAYFNLDQTGYRIRGLYLEGNETLRPVFASWFAPFRAFGEYHLVNTKTGGSDQDNFNAVGVPGFFFIQDGSPYVVWTGHSSSDLYDHLVPSDLQQSAAILAFFAYQAAMREELLPRLPRKTP